MIWGAAALLLCRLRRWSGSSRGACPRAAWRALAGGTDARGHRGCCGSAASSPTTPIPGSGRPGPARARWTTRSPTRSRRRTAEHTPRARLTTRRRPYGRWAASRVRLCDGPAAAAPTPARSGPSQGASSCRSRLLRGARGVCCLDEDAEQPVGVVVTRDHRVGDSGRARRTCRTPRLKSMSSAMTTPPGVSAGQACESSNCTFRVVCMLSCTNRSIVPSAVSSGRSRCLLDPRISVQRPRSRSGTATPTSVCRCRSISGGRSMLQSRPDPLRVERLEHESGRHAVGDAGLHDPLGPQMTHETVGGRRRASVRRRPSRRTFPGPSRGRGPSDRRLSPATPRRSRHRQRRAMGSPSAACRCACQSLRDGVRERRAAALAPLGEPFEDPVAPGVRIREHGATGTRRVHRARSQRRDGMTGRAAAHGHRSPGPPRPRATQRFV